MKADLDLLNQLLTRAEREQKFRSYRGLLRGIQAFHLDNETVEVVAEMSSGEARHKMIPLYRELARLPFDRVWIEHDYLHLHRWRSERGYTTTLDSDHHVNGVPYQIGFLCERLVAHEGAFRVTTVGFMSPGHGDPATACLFPLCHNVTTGRDKVFFVGHRADDQALTDLIAAANRSPLPCLAWGMQRGASVEVHEWLESPLHGTNGVEPEGIFVDTMLAKYGRERGLENIQRQLTAAALEQKGDLRFVVAALALLNHVPVVYKPHKPKGRMLAAGTTKPFIEARVVSLDVPNTRRRLKLIDRNLRNSLIYQRRKRHRVRGHWRVSTRSHGDRWEPFTDPFTLQRRWRTWITDHERGDASLGWVDHTYRVHGRPGARAAVGLGQHEETTP